MALFDAIRAQTPEGQTLRSGLLHAGLGMLAGSYGNYGALMPALAGGAAGFAQGQDLAQKRIMQDEEMKWRRAQMEQMQMLQQLQIGKLARDAMLQQQYDQWRGGGTPTTAIPQTQQQQGSMQQPTVEAFPVSEIGAPTVTIPTTNTRSQPRSEGKEGSTPSYMQDSRYQQLLDATLSGNPYIAADANKQLDLLRKERDADPRYQAEMELAKKRAAEQAKTETEMPQRKQAAMQMINAVDSSMGRLEQVARELRNHPGLPRIVGLQGMVPNRAGSDASNAEAIRSRLMALSAFSELADMRANSPTGGALGNVTERELDMLGNAAGSLDVRQSLEAVQKQLDDIIKRAEQSRRNVYKSYEEQFGPLDLGGHADDSGAVMPADDDEDLSYMW